MAALATCKRLLGRLFGIGVLVGAGYAAFHVSKTVPRCVIDSDTRILHFAPDGNTIVTGHQAVVIGNYTGGGNDAHGKPPLKVWDTRSGQLVRTLLDDVKQFKRYDVCAKRPLIAVALDGVIRLADWRTGKEWNVEVGPGEIERLEFGPNGDVLSVRIRGQRQPELMIDVERSEVVHRFDADARASGFSSDGALWRFALKGRLHDWRIISRQVERDYPGGVFHCDERLLVYSEPDDINFVICDAASMAVKTRIKPAMPAMPAMPAGIENLNVLLNAVPAEMRPEVHRRIQGCRHLAFSPSGRRAATFAQPFDHLDGVLEIWDVDTGERIATFPELKRGWAMFSFENVLEFLDRSHTPHNAFPQIGPTVFNIHTIIDLPAGTIRWRRPANLGRLFTLPTDASAGAVLSEDGRTLLVHDMGTIGFGFRRTEKATQRSYFYDLHSRRPWLWAIATPAAMLVPWVMWRTWRVRRRPHAMPGAQTPEPATSHGEPAA